MFIFHYTVEDADTDKASIELAFTGDATLPANLVVLAVTDVWEIIAPLVNGKLVSAWVSINADISAFNSPADVLSDVQEQATFSFRALDNGRLDLTLSTFIETFFLSAGASKIVNTSATEVASFVTLFNGDGLFVMDGYSPETIHPATKHGEETYQLIKADQNWGKRRKR